MSFNINNFIRTGPILERGSRYFVYTTDDTWFDINESSPPYFSGAIELVRSCDIIRVVADDATKLIEVNSVNGAAVTINPLETL